MADVGHLDVAQNAVLVLGREQGCDIRLDSGNVSRRHAQITVGPEGFVVEDLSANGTIMPSGEVLHREAAWYPYGYYFIVGPFLVTVGATAAAAPAPAPPSRKEPPPSARRGRRNGAGVGAATIAEAKPSVRAPKDHLAATNAHPAATHLAKAGGTQRAGAGVVLPLGMVAPSLPSAPGDAARARALVLKHSEDLLALRRRVHAELLKNLDFAKIDPLKPDPSLRPRVLTALKRIVGQENAPILAEVDRDAFIGEVLEEALGLGPLEPLLADPAVTEIMVVDPATIYVERAGLLELTTTRFTDEERVRAVIERIVTPLGRRIDESQPLVDARLPDGSRVNAIIRPLALRGSCITIRRFPKKRLTVEDFIRLGSLTARIAKFLERAVIAKKNILISGGTGSGKTTLLNVLSASIPSTERIVTIEDAAELQLHQPHVVSLETKHANMEGKGAFTIRDLVKNSLRMRPDRIVVGECRGGEALDMLQAMNTGHDGSLTTIHANSPIEALSRLETLVLMAGVELPSKAIREQIARSIHVIVQQTRLTDGTRKITHVSEIDELGPDGQFEVRPIFQFEQTGVSSEGKVIGDFDATGYLPSFLDEIMARGLVSPGEPFL